MKINSINDIVKFLDNNFTGFLATKGTCGNPRVRPVQSALVYNGKIYFCTSIKKNLYKHIQNHSGVEYCSCAENGAFVRLRGEAKIVNDKGAKEAIFAKYPLVKDRYKSADNPHFAVFYLENISAQWQFGEEAEKFVEEK